MHHMYQDDIFKQLIHDAIIYIRSKDYKFQNLESLVDNVRNFIAENTSHEWLFVKSYFINFNVNHYDLLDIIIFNSISNFKIIFIHELEYINELTAPRNHDGLSLYTKISSTYNKFDIFYSEGNIQNEICRSIADIISRCKLIILNYLIKNNIGLVNTLYNKPNQQIIDSIIKSHKINCSQILFENVITDPELLTSTDCPFKEIQITPQNAIFNFDIDGISAIANHKEVLGIKSNIKLNYNSKSTAGIYSKNIFLHHNASTINIQELYSIHIAHIPLSESNQLKMFLVFPKNKDFLKNDKLESLIANINTEILKEADNFISSNRMFHYHAQMNRQIDEIVKISGTVDALFISNVLLNLSNSLKITPLVFIECYNTKYALEHQNPKFLLDSLFKIFNMNILLPKIDLCTTISAKNQGQNVLCMKNTFLKSEKTIDQYTLLNCWNVSNYHGYLLKHDSNKNSIQKFCNGIEKLNIYSPIINFLVPKYMRTKKYPTFSGALLASNLYGWAPEPKSEKIIKKMSNYLSELRSNIQNSFNISLGIRVEFRISALNFLSCLEFTKNALLNKSYFLVDSSKIKQLLASSLENVIKMIDFRTRKYSFNDIVKSSVLEQSFFEYYIRGGNNLNILPKRAKTYIDGFCTTFMIAPIPENLDFELTESEKTEILNKLIKYNKSFSIQTREKITKLMKFIALDTYQNYIDLLPMHFKSDLCYIFNNLLDSNFSAGPDNFAKKMANPISATEVFNFFFINPSKNLIHLLYMGLYAYIKSVAHDDNKVKEDIINSFHEKNIKFIPEKISNGNCVIREVIYVSKATDDQILEKIEKIQASITLGFNQRYAYNNHNIMNHSIRRREPDVSLAELLMIYHGLYQDGLSNNHKKKLFHDIRYPFILYCKQSRLESGSRTLKARIKKGMVCDRILGEFDISQFYITNLILYLNYNKRSFLSPDSIKLAEQLLSFANNRKHYDRDDEFYETMYKSQRDYEDLEGVLETIFGNSFSKAHDFILSNSRISPSIFRPTTSFQLTQKTNISKPTLNNIQITHCLYHPKENTIIIILHSQLNLLALINQ